MRGFRRGTVATLLVALVVVGCGSNSQESTTTSQAVTTTGVETTTPEQATSTPAGESPPVSLPGEVNDHGTAAVENGSIEIEQDNFYFDPTFIQAEPGATVEVELKNEGSAPHTFTIDDQDVDVELDPGQSKTVEVTIPDSGSLRFYCRFHANQGMQGAFFTATG